MNCADMRMGSQMHYSTYYIKHINATKELQMVNLQEIDSKFMED